MPMFLFICGVVVGAFALLVIRDALRSAVASHKAKVVRQEASEE